MNWKEYKSHVKNTDLTVGKIIRTEETKQKLCRWFYEHKMHRIAYHISPCTTTMMDARRICDSLREGIKEQKESSAFMSPAEFAERLREIDKDSCVEEFHIEADKIMCEILESLGYGEGIKIFKDHERWYS